MNNYALILVPGASVTETPQRCRIMLTAFIHNEKKQTRSTGAVYASAKARLASVAIRIRIRIATKI